MSEKEADSATSTWKTPQCPFTIEYSLRALDDIRLAVADAFFSLPRGGVEIGGILLGISTKRRLVIADYVPLDCEHASGPSFTLSRTDEKRLAELLAAARRNTPALQPVGWYHSHTRSEMFLSEVDQDLHERYFPEPWQVALVLKPHTFHPTRAGFFFREEDGSIHGAASYQEFVLEPLPACPIPARVTPATESSPSARPGYGPDPRGRASTLAAEQPNHEPTPPAEPAPPAPEAPSGTAEEPEPQPVDPPLPKFLETPATPGWHGFAVVLAAAAGLAVAVAGYQTQSLWLPGLMAAIQPEPQLSIGLSAIDSDGQLQVQWDGNALAARHATNAILEIDDGPFPQEIQLDALHLTNGTFTYVRRGEQVDVKLAVYMPSGRQVHGATSFLGKLPERTPPPEDPEIRRQRDELAQQADKLKSELAAEAARTRRLEKSLNDVKKVLQDQQRSRSESQSPGK